jgi:hypothetical protein
VDESFFLFGRENKGTKGEFWERFLMKFISNEGFKK